MHGIVEQNLYTFTFIGTIIWNQSNLITLIQNNHWKKKIYIYIYIDYSNKHNSSKSHNDMCRDDRPNSIN